ncbi:hypothetical protein GBAR_LOCUS15371 [Geodia barretti]|uniref:Uncharacterized protein n=1 Tax=Geodia barretti TaxID=519541 RepID=A0AA35SB39_GEOBA|nr:hypothetical protein GBAR_LOCUS15371 [Geodia barretti]
MLSPTVSLARERCFLSLASDIWNIFNHLCIYIHSKVCSMRWRGLPSWLGSGLRGSQSEDKPPCVPQPLNLPYPTLDSPCTSLRSGDDCGGNREKTQWLKEVHNSLQTPLPMDPPY